MNTVQPILDRAAIGTSTLCALHCLATPVVLTLFPSLVTSFLGDHLFHLMLVFFVVPVSSVGLMLGCRKHKDSVVLLFGVVGIVSLAVVAVFGHDFLGETGEKVGTVIASLILVFAHVRNYRLCRQAVCQH